jgi:phosphotransferase system HPr (HPr) family protein
MDGQSVSHTVTVRLENGLHLVPCSRLVKLANGLGCDVRIRKGSVDADIKNIFDLMGLAAAFGDQLEVRASGDGAEQALAMIVQLFESNFGD